MKRKKKKSGNQSHTDTQSVVNLITALVELVTAILILYSYFTE